jgi:hypothetical protein
MSTTATRLMPAALPLIGLAACASEKATMEESKAPKPSLAAVDQSVSGDRVEVISVTLPEAGFVVIHAVIDGQVQAPQSIGHTAVGPGATANATIVLDKAPAAGSTLLAMLHHDSGTAGAYEFGPGSVDNDKPVVVDGKPVLKAFKVM